MTVGPHSIDIKFGTLPFTGNGSFFKSETIRLKGSLTSEETGLNDILNLELISSFSVSVRSDLEG